MEFRDMILDVVARMRPLVAQGRTYEQIAAANLTAQYADRGWGDPERFLRGVFDELGGGM
jgi:hypothetical protein